jgi:hypothetical protein
MKLSAPKTALALSIALATAITAHAQQVPPEGVVVDISVVDPRNDNSSNSSTGAVTELPRVTDVEETDAIFSASLDSPLVSSSGVRITLASAAPAPAPKKPEAAATSENVAAEPATGETTTGETTTAEPKVEAPEAKAIKAEPVAAEAPKQAPPAATESEVSKGGKALLALVDAMRPGDVVAPLENNRLSFYLSEKVAFAQYESSAKRFGLDRARTHLAFLFSEERDTVLQAGLALDAAFTSSLRLSFGTRSYIAILSDENQDSLAVSVGAETAYQLPFETLPLEFGASFYYAPDILTFGVGDRAIDAQVDVTLPVREQFSVFGGIRYFQIDTRPEDREIDNRLHVGVRWDFL